MPAKQVDATDKGVSDFLFDLLFAEAPKKSNFLGAHSPNSAGRTLLAFSDDKGTKRTFAITVAEVSEGKVDSSMQAQDAPGVCKPCCASGAGSCKQAEEGRGQEAVEQDASKPVACKGG